MKSLFILVVSGGALLAQTVTTTDIQTTDQISASRAVINTNTNNLKNGINAHVSNTSNPHAVTAAQTGAVPNSAVGASNGVASLGSDGKVPAAQLPAASSGLVHSSQFADWKFTRVSGTQLKFADNCLPATPCNVDIGGTTTQFTDGPYLINLSGSNVSGSICVYITPANQITVGIGNGLSSANITGSNSLAFVAGVNSCPQDAIKLAKWDVSAGAFLTSGFAFAPYISYKPSPLGGAGIQVTAGQRDTIQIDTASVLRKFKCAGGPSTTLPSGATQGDICFDFNPATPVSYVCTNAAGCTTAADWKGF